MVFPTVILLITVSVGFKTQTKITVLLSVNNKYRLTGWNHLHLKTLTEVNNTRNQHQLSLPQSADLSIQLILDGA